MLTHLARRISSFFISNRTMREDERQIYDYCFEIMLSTILNFCSVMVIAIITKTVFLTLCFIVGFMIIRATAGGYHAETHMACFMILIVSYVIYLVILLNLSNNIISVLTIIICVISTLLIIFLAPVEDHNKPLTKAEVEVPAAYCYVCDKYYILDEDYRMLKKKGVVLCHIDEKEELVKDYDYDDCDFELNKESLLHKI